MKNAASRPGAAISSHNPDSESAGPTVESAGVDAWCGNDSQLAFPRGDSLSVSATDTLFADIGLKVTTCLHPNRQVDSSCGFVALGLARDVRRQIAEQGLTGIQ